MEPSRDVCQALAKFHPWLRIAWDNELRQFGLVQLYHNRDFKKTYRESWKRRGPIFAKNGSTKQDWDSMIRNPVYVIDLDFDDVRTGFIVKKVKRWARPFVSRAYTNAIESNRAVESQIDDIVHSRATDLYKEGQRDGSGAPIVAKKFAEPSQNEIRAKEDSFNKDHFTPPPPSGGYARHLEADFGDIDDLGDVGR